jgi:uncharacterized protein (DUF2336 family)
LGVREREMMIDILGRLLGEVDVKMRSNIARRLAANPHAPRSLLRDLANDTIEVARPILRESRMLEDMDLIEVIHQRGFEHRLAIARRTELSLWVSNALVRSGDEVVIVALLNNEGSRLSQETMTFLAERSRQAEAFQVPLLNRAELTAGLARRMSLWISAPLRGRIVERFGPMPPAAEGLPEDTVALKAAGTGRAKCDAYLTELR